MSTTLFFISPCVDSETETRAEFCWTSRLCVNAQVEKVEKGSWLYYCGSNATDAPQSLSSLHRLQQQSHKSAKWVSVYLRALLQVVLSSFCSRKPRHDHNSLFLNPQGFRYHYNEKPQPPELTRRSGGQGQKTLRVSGVLGISYTNTRHTPTEATIER